MIGRKYDLSIRLVVVGDSGVGKTSYLLRYIRGEYDPEMQPTLGVEFLTKEITAMNRKIQVQLWDTAGQELFRSVTRGYYRGSFGAFLFFAITNRESFKNIEQWIYDVQNSARPKVVLILIGNKKDMEAKREVQTEEALNFANLHQMPYFETSAKMNFGINAPMEECINRIIKMIENNEFEIESEENTETPKVLTEEKERCC